MAAIKKRQNIQKKYWLIISGLIAISFAFKALTAIDLTDAWKDELSTVTKSFQPSLSYMINYLQIDTHPPLFYLQTWITGHIFGQTLITLRAASYFCYILTALTLAYATKIYSKNYRASATALVLSTSLPFLIRYSIEGKGYALLTLAISLSILFRIKIEKQYSIFNATGYIISLMATSLTHYYGFAFVLIQGLLDIKRSKKNLYKPNLIALVPGTLWMISSLNYLIGNGGRTWLKPADLHLVKEIISLTFGSNYVLAGLLIFTSYGIIKTAGHANLEKIPGIDNQKNPIESWCVDTSLVLFVTTILISVVKPSAHPRYYIVVIPPLIGFCSCSLGRELLIRDLKAIRLSSLTLISIALLAIFWHDGYQMLIPNNEYNKREAGLNYRAIALTASLDKSKVSRQCNWLNKVDKLLASGNIIQPISEWACIKDSNLKPLRKELARLENGDEFSYAILHKGSQHEQDIKKIESLGGKCFGYKQVGPNSRVYNCKKLGEH